MSGELTTSLPKGGAPGQVLTKVSYDNYKVDWKDPAGGGGGGDGEVYSTEETRIGTWIDGRPLYRQCIEQKWNLSNGINTFNINVSNDIDLLIGIRTITWINVNLTTTCDIAYPSFLYNSNSLRGVLIKEGTKTTIQVNISANSSRSGINNIVIIEYTKTTD